VSLLEKFSFASEHRKVDLRCSTAYSGFDVSCVTEMPLCSSTPAGLGEQGAGIAFGTSL